MPSSGWRRKIRDSIMAMGDPPDYVTPAGKGLDLTGLMRSVDFSNVMMSTEQMVNPLAQASISSAESHMRSQLAQIQLDKWRNESLAGLVNGPATASQLTLAERARELFLRRMGGIRKEMTVAGGDYVICHVYVDKVFLFYCFAGKAGVIDEEIDMFPSDKLIAQFRMMLA